MDKVKEEIKDRVSNKTISDYWKRIKEISLVVSSLSGATIATLAALAITPPGWIASILAAVSVSSAFLAGRAQIDKSKKK